MLAVSACARPVSRPVAAEPVAAAPVAADARFVAPEPGVVATPHVAPVGLDPGVMRRAELAAGDPESKCDGAMQRARCLQARAHPEVAFHWTLYWFEEGEAAEKAARRQRVVDRLRADGATNIGVMGSVWSVEVVATHPAIRGAMAMHEVWRVQVECAEGEREHCACARLRVDQCEAHAFCHPLYGWPRRPDTACIGPRQLAGCTRAGACSDAVTYALDPAGQPWMFPNSCQPEQPGWRGVQMKEHMSPAWQAVHGAPMCPEPAQ